MQLKKVNFKKICQDFGIRTIPYTKYWTEVPPEVDETWGMTFKKEGVPTILYDDRKPTNIIHFTIAHELGHLFLGHVKGEMAEELKGRWARVTPSPMEREADLFAVVLLAYDLLCQYGAEDPSV